jgi:hypothetical protein
MDQKIDPHLQRIIDNATGANNKNPQERNLHYAAEEQRSFGVGARQPPQESPSSNDFGQLP